MAQIYYKVCWMTVVGARLVGNKIAIKRKCKQTNKGCVILQVEKDKEKGMMDINLRYVAAVTSLGWGLI